MTLDSYRNFVEIVDCGSILAAANKLLIAQPSLSNQLKNIEKHYGARLINRGSRGIELTDAGRLFYKKAKEICQLEESIRNEITNSKTSFTELLKISLPAGNSTHFLHKLFDHFIAGHPTVNYDLYEVPIEFITGNVLNGVTEIGLIRSTVPSHSALSIYPYEREDIVAIMPKDHPLAKNPAPLTIPELAGLPLSVPFDCLDIIYTVFGHYLLAPNVSIITSPKSTAVEWARSFGSVALVSMAEYDTGIAEDLIIRKIDEPNMYVMSAFLVNRQRQLSETAVSFLREHIPDFEPPYHA